MFTSQHKVTLTSLVGPFDTFEEMQGATALQTPGAICIKAGPGTNQNTGAVKDASGNTLGTWSRT